jgi:hypothetical protein
MEDNKYNGPVYTTYNIPENLNKKWIDVVKM